jgi:putative ABC transport system permease protein
MTGFMTIIKQAFANLAMNRGRTVLTMFGIIWGIATVIILVALISGFNEQNVKQMEQNGVNMLVLEYSDTYMKDGVLYPLVPRLEDAAYIAENCPYVKEAVPQVESWTEMTAGQQSHGFHVVASTDEIKDEMELKPEVGRFFNSIDFDTRAKVIVVGYRIADEFFGSGGGGGFGGGGSSSAPAETPKAVGKTVSIFGQEFSIIGQLPRQRSQNDWTAYMPLTVFQSVFATPTNPLGGNMTIYATLDSPVHYDAGSLMVRKLLNARYGLDPADEDAIRLRDFAEWRKEASAVFLMFFAVFYTIGLLTLTIGAVGVMNVMLVSVQERTREIGLRKALGATPGVIISQFVFETLAITITGGVAGMALGLVIVGALRALPLPDTFPPPVITVSVIIVAAISNIVVGLFASILPSKRAANLDPIVSLRAE